MKLTHCQNLAPVYEELADAFAHAKDKVIVAKVDADGAGRPLGQKYGVTGFPSASPAATLHLLFSHVTHSALKWFDGKGSDVKYESGRDLESLAGLYALF